MKSTTREYTTEHGMTVTDHGDEIVMQTAPANVIPFPRKRDLSWLMAETLSTESAYRDTRDYA